MPENELRAHDLAFFGRILAGQTHELTNVLNVINELTGLEQDILAAAHTPTPPVEKLQQIVDKVRHQLQRGEALLRLLNRFAHSVDQPVAIFDVREALERIIALAQRPALLARTELRSDFPARALSLATSLFGFQHAVFTCIELALGAAAQQRRIVVGYLPGVDAAEITIVSGDPIPANSGVSRTRAVLERLVAELGGRIATESAADAAYRFRLCFPNARAGPGQENTAEDRHVP